MLCADNIGVEAWRRNPVENGRRPEIGSRGTGLSRQIACFHFDSHEKMYDGKDENGKTLCERPAFPPKWRSPVSCLTRSACFLSRPELS